MSVYTHELPRPVPDVLRQVCWSGTVSFAALVVPYLGVSLLGLQHDLVNPPVTR